jgi:hypothetical protein
MDPLTVYSTCLAVKLHFERGSYDAFKFNFKGPSRKVQSFLKSNDRFSYERVAKKYPKRDDLIAFLLSNIIGGKKWIRDMDDETYLIWVSKMQSMQYRFNTDINALWEFAIDNKLNFDECLKPHEGSIPILDLYRLGKLQLETLVIIDVLVSFTKGINKKTVSDPLGILSDAVYLIEQYKPFIRSRINISASKNCIINLFTYVGK